MLDLAFGKDSKGYLSSVVVHVAGSKEAVLKAKDILVHKVGEYCAPGPNYKGILLECFVKQKLAVPTFDVQQYVDWTTRYICTVRAQEGESSTRDRDFNANGRCVRLGSELLTKAQTQVVESTWGIIPVGDWWCHSLWSFRRLHRVWRQFSRQQD